MKQYSSNINIITGNIFTTKLQTIVNTVNCVGVMGAGIAFEFKLRYPKMFERYVNLCSNHKIEIGILWLYKTDGEKMILNFPTKIHWKDPSKIEYLEKGLKKFLETYEEKKIISIAFPILGASKGGIDEQLSLSLMTKYLSECDIPIEIYRYDPLAYDDLFIEFKKKFLSFSVEELKNKTRLRITYIEKIKNALMDDSIRSMSRLAIVDGIGVKSLEKSFQFAMNNSEDDLKLEFK